MMILDMYSSRIGDHDECGVELSDLVEQEISDDKSDEIALMILDIFFVFHDISEFFIEDAHSYGEDIDILVEIFI
jgi:hypothetical protein